jgi:hypothetical protein
MAGEEEHFESCRECGATIYPEHVAKGVAEQWEGKLLCPFCLKEKRAASGVGIAAPQAAAAGAAPGAGPVAVVELESAESVAGSGAPIAYERKPTAVRASGASGVGGSGMPVGRIAEAQHRRALLTGSPNATRCKTFHCKLADGPIAYMCEQINEWVDSDDHIEIKFATSTIGVVEGKHVDPHLLVTVFY